MLNVLLVICENFLDEDLYKDFPKKHGKLNIVKILHGIDKVVDSDLTRDLDMVILKLENPKQEWINKLKSSAFKRGISVMTIRSTDRDRRKYNNGYDFVLDKLGEIGQQVEVCSVVGSMQESLVVIGSSTGGPQALQKIIPKLPSRINASILIVQHMPPKFTKSLAERLNLESSVLVKEAEQGDILEKGNVYIAPGDYHMLIKESLGKLKIELNKDEKHKGVRPAVDLLMNSVAQISKYSKMGIILTGMGSDGAQGISSMKESNSYNIVQDKKSCVVYGMPKAALDTGDVDEVISLDKIANEIIIKVGCNNGFRCKSIS